MKLDEHHDDRQAARERQMRIVRMLLSGVVAGLVITVGVQFYFSSGGKADSQKPERKSAPEVAGRINNASDIQVPAPERRAKPRQEPLSRQPQPDSARNSRAISPPPSKKVLKPGGQHPEVSPDKVPPLRIQPATQPLRTPHSPQPREAPADNDRMATDQFVLRGEVVSEEEQNETMVWGLDRDSIQGSIRERHQEFHRCYDAWLEVEPELAGRMKLGFTIGRATDKDSHFTVVDLDLVDSDLDHAVFEGCVLGALQDLVYEAGDGQIEINYPLVFRAEDN